MKIIPNKFLRNKFSERKIDHVLSTAVDYVSSKECVLHDGYADFCKLMFVPNTTGVKIKPSHIRLDPWVYQYIRTEYNARRKEELPVLIQYAKVPWELENAKYLFYVLYDREQTIKENPELESVEFDYSIVHISGQDDDYEYPMLPITILRNALGIEEGGSGIPIDREKYSESVIFYKKYIHVRN